MNISRYNLRTAVVIGTTALVMVPALMMATPVMAVYPETTDSTTAPLRTSSTVLAERMENLRQRAIFEIDRRTKSLTELSDKLGELKRLTDGQRSEFLSQIQLATTSLYNLKNKIAADTDFDTLKSDTQSIVDTYRVYVVLMPQIRILAAADAMAEAATKLTDLSVKLQSRITEASSKGKDVTALQTSLDAMKAKISDAQSQYNTIDTTIPALTPEGYPANKTVLEAGRQALKTGAEDLKAARESAKSIVDGLKALATPAETK